tara:strand:- start:23 stop:250 length:228 start_codon:yes stop_codon:yes gene_type:complete
MSKISKEGYEQIKVIKNALDSMYDKLNRSFYTKAEGKVKDIEKQYQPAKIFESVQSEFESIAGIVENTGTWEEVQ